MKTKIVYVLTSSDKDIYLEQAYISMYSVKQYEPDSHIVLITDRTTHNTFSDVTRKAKLKYVDELIVIDLDSSYTAQQRSRILKTSVRLNVKGDFLFIDTDTIIVSALNEIDNCPYSIAAVMDTHCLFKDNPYRADNINDGKKLNWAIAEEEVYFNSGVIYAKDNKEAHDFYQLWYKNMLESQRVGVNMDQPSFAKTNCELNHIVKVLDGIWNCQYKHGLKFLPKARIVHYLCTNVTTNSKQPFILNEKAEFLYTKQTSEISHEVKEAICYPFAGIPDTVHIFSWSDLFFFQIILYKITRYLFQHKIVFNLIERVLSVFYRIVKNK